MGDVINSVVGAGSRAFSGGCFMWVAAGECFDGVVYSLVVDEPRYDQGRV